MKKAVAWLIFFSSLANLVLQTFHILIILSHEAETAVFSMSSATDWPGNPPGYPGSRQAVYNRRLFFHAKHERMRKWLASGSHVCQDHIWQDQSIFFLTAVRARIHFFWNFSTLFHSITHIHSLGELILSHHSVTGVLRHAENWAKM